MSLQIDVTGSLDALKADKEALEKDFADLHAKADAHKQTAQDLKKAIIQTIIELAKVVMDLAKLTVKRS